MEKLLFERSMFFILCEFWLKVKDSSEVRRKNFFGHCRLFNSPYLTLYICFMQCHLADPPLMKWKNFFHPFVFEPPSWLLWKEGDRYNIILVVDPDIKRPCSFYLHSFALFSPLNCFFFCLGQGLMCWDYRDAPPHWLSFILLELCPRPCN